jgi:hypothetical protein
MLRARIVLTEIPDAHAGEAAGERKCPPCHIRDDPREFSMAGQRPMTLI